MHKTDLDGKETTSIFRRLYEEKGSIKEARIALKRDYGVEITGPVESGLYKRGLNPNPDIVPSVTSTARNMLRAKGEPSVNVQLHGMDTPKHGRPTFWKNDDWPTIYEAKLRIRTLREQGLTDEEISKRTGWSMEFIKQKKETKESKDVDAFRMFGGKSDPSRAVP